MRDIPDRLDGSAEVTPQCPSARPEMEGAKIFGVVGGTADAPRVQTLSTPMNVSSDLLSLASPAEPTEVFRFTAPCAGGACQHFDGHDCTLATRIVELMPPVMQALPACPIRPECRWYLQEGPDACFRCPQIVSNTFDPSPELSLAADPRSII